MQTYITPWFKFWVQSNKELFDLMTDEQIGRTIRAALNYCESGSTPDLQALDKIEQASFKRLCNNIDEAAESYRARSKAGQENGKQGGRGNKKYKTMPDDETERLRKDILSQANLYKCQRKVIKGNKSQLKLMPLRCAKAPSFFHFYFSVYLISRKKKPIAFYER